MKLILCTSNTEAFYQLYYTEVNCDIVQIIFKQILMSKKLQRYQKANISEKNCKFSAFRFIENSITLSNHEKIPSAIKFSRNKFHGFLSDLNINSFFIKPVDKTEIKNVTLSLSSLDAVGQ